MVYEGLVVQASKDSTTRPLWKVYESHRKSQRFYLQVKPREQICTADFPVS